MLGMCIDTCCCPLIGINIVSLSDESNLKKVFYLIVYTILNIFLLTIRGLINLVLTPLLFVMGCVRKLNFFQVCKAVFLPDLLIVPVIGHIVFYIIYNLIKPVTYGQNSCLDQMLTFALYPHHMLSTGMAELIGNPK